MRGSRSSNVGVGAIAFSAMLLVTTTTVAQTDPSWIDRDGFGAGAMDASTLYQAIHQHAALGPNLQSMGVYDQGVLGVVTGIAPSTGVADSFSLEDFLSPDFIRGDTRANWDAIREILQMTTPEWVHPSDAIEFRTWQ